MKDVTIKPVLNGWRVKVGCQEVVFDDLSKMIKELRRYIKYPNKVEKEYTDNNKNKEKGFDGLHHLVTATANNADCTIAIGAGGTGTVTTEGTL